MTTSPVDEPLAVIDKYPVTVTRLPILVYPPAVVASVIPVLPPPKVTPIVQVPVSYLSSEYPVPVPVPVVAD